MFKQAVEHIIKENEKLIIVSAVVKDIADNSFTASRTGMADLLEVRLNSVLTPVKDNVLVVPKVGSVVLLGIIENNKSNAVLLSVSEVDKVQIKQSGLEFEISEGKFVFKNEFADLKQVITNGFNALIDAVLVVSGTTATYDPATKIVVKNELSKLDKLIK